jgi:hypothetical protein
MPLTGFCLALSRAGDTSLSLLNLRKGFDSGRSAFDSAGGREASGLAVESYCLQTDSVLSHPFSLNFHVKGLSRGTTVSNYRAGRAS